MRESKSKITKGHVGGGIATLLVALLSTPGVAAWFQKGDAAEVAYEVLVKEIEHLQSEQARQVETDKLIYQTIRDLKQSLLVLHTAARMPICGSKGGGGTHGAMVGMPGMEGFSEPSPGVMLAPPSLITPTADAMEEGLSGLIDPEPVPEPRLEEVGLKPLEDLLKAPQQKAHNLPNALDDLLKQRGK